jgi:hypothetical protein
MDLSCCQSNIEALNPEPEDEPWLHEVVREDTIEPEGTKHIGTDESWIQLTWNFTHRIAFLTFYTAEGETSIECWRETMWMPEMSNETDINIVRHLTHLANLCYSLWAASLDGVSLVSPFAETLFNFRSFLERVDE